MLLDLQPRHVMAVFPPTLPCTLEPEGGVCVSLLFTVASRPLFLIPVLKRQFGAHGIRQHHLLFLPAAAIYRRPDHPPSCQEDFSFWFTASLPISSPAGSS